MNTTRLSHLSNNRLLQATAAIVRQGHTQTAALVTHLAEVQRRRAYREAGYGSMYKYCLHELHLSEHSAYKHVWAVRLARRYPEVLDAVASGRVHLAGLRELGRYMTSENATDLLAAATHQTRAEIMLMLANRFPRPDVPTVVVRLAPAATSTHEATGDLDRSPGTPTAVATPAASDPKLAPGRVVPSPHAGIARPLEPVSTHLDQVPPCLTPTSPGRFGLQVALDQRSHDLLRCAQELLGQGSPAAEIPRVLERALEDLVHTLKYQKFAATDSPRARRSAGAARYIPADVRRRVAERDGYQCAFVSATGHRCDERSDLEFDHVQPVARGGRTTVENLRLLCPAHNQYEAERVFGDGFMCGKREAAGHAATCVRERSPDYAPASTSGAPEGTSGPRALRRRAGAARALRRITPSPRKRESPRLLAARASCVQTSDLANTQAGMLCG